ncbi:hypothetical protein N9M17_00770 [bacterium]|nr:hypothetical protein [bacterium]
MIMSDYDEFEAWSTPKRRKNRKKDAKRVNVYPRLAGGIDEIPQMLGKEPLAAEDRPEEERMTRERAEALAGEILGWLEPLTDYAEVAGSYRRGRQDPGDLDVIVILKNRVKLPEIAELWLAEGKASAVNWVGEKKTQLLIDGVKVDIRTSTPRALGAALLYFTGPAGYNIGIRSAAKRAGFKLSEYGLFDRETGEYIAGATEEEIYTAMGRNYRPPTERRAESYTPPASAISAAKRGLEQRKKYGRGGLSPAEAKSQGIDSGVTRARKIASGKVSKHDVRRMSAFNRHRKNNNPGKKMPDGGPTAGTIAWNLWGGSAGVNWAKKKSAAMNAETFVLGAETGFCPACGETDLMLQYYEDSGDFGCLECGHQWFEKTRMRAEKYFEAEEWDGSVHLTKTCRCGRQVQPYDFEIKQFADGGKYVMAKYRCNCGGGKCRNCRYGAAEYRGLCSRCATCMRCNFSLKQDYEEMGRDEGHEHGFCHKCYDDTGRYGAEDMNAETQDFADRFEIQIRTSRGNTTERIPVGRSMLVRRLREILGRSRQPYAIDVFGTEAAFNVMGPYGMQVYRPKPKLLAVYKYGQFESGEMADHLNEKLGLI